jgi:putative DNA methylase
MSDLIPFALQDAPALIERLFPAQKISAEAQKERKAGAGQTLTALGSYWKGRKPLIMVRAIILGCLLPVTEDLEADLRIFERLMGIDDESFTRREPKLTASALSQMITLANPWDYFDYALPKSSPNLLFVEESAEEESPLAPLNARQSAPGRSPKSRNHRRSHQKRRSRGLDYRHR